MTPGLFATALVVLHAHALTQVPAHPSARALAIVDGRFAYVGDDEAAARRAAGRDAAVLDAGGRAVVPGFNDAHVHFGLSLTLGGPRGVELPELGRAAFRDAVRAAAAQRPPAAGDAWLFVVTPALPDGIRRARDLDFVARPLFVVSHHGSLLNRRALAALGLEALAGDGFIRGRAVASVLDQVVRTLPAQRLVDEARAFTAELARLGLTSVQLIDDVPAPFETLRQAGELTARVRLLAYGFHLDDWLAHDDWHAEAPEWVRVDGVKYYHDEWAPLSRFEIERVYESARAAGRRVVLHVLSRHALDTLLTTLERVSHGDRAATHLIRVDHADEVTAAQAARLAALDMIVCSNPSMIPEWHRADAFPLRTLVDGGVKLCIGTDWVGPRRADRPLAPLASLGLAATHGGFGSAERIPAATALSAYTVGSAAAEGMAGEKGALAQGQLGDLVVLSDDPTQVAPERIGAIEVLATVVGGRVVYRRPDFAAR